MITSRQLAAKIRAEIGVRVSVRNIRGIVTVYRAKDDLGCFSHEEALKVERLCEPFGLTPWLGAYSDRPECDRASLIFMPIH